MNELSHTKTAGRSFQVYGLTDIGCVRDHNEDDYRICYDLSENMWGHSPGEGYPLGAKGALLVLADGMGGAEAGEVASRIAVEGVRQYFTLTAIEAQISEEEVRKHLNAVFNKVYEALSIQASQNISLARMGTTLTVAWIFHDIVYIAWVGDSRAYLYNPNGIRNYNPTSYMDCNSRMRILTEDHSLVWEKVKKTLGRYTPEEARLSGESNIILRCLGHDHHHEVPDITGPIYFSGGDILLLCSDGLNSMLSDFQIEKSIDPKKSLAENCYQLIGSANKAGGRDNITVILSTFIDSIGSDPKIQFQQEASTSSHLPSLSNYKQNLNKKTSKPILLITVIFLISILGIFSIIHFQKAIPNDHVGFPYVTENSTDTVSKINSPITNTVRKETNINPKQTLNDKDKNVETESNNSVDKSSENSPTQNVESLPDGNLNTKSSILKEVKNPEYKFKISNKVTFEMTNCKPTKDYEKTKLERTLSGGEYYYKITKNIFKTILYKACNEKEISVELKNYKGKMIVEYYIQKSENQNKGQYPDIAIKSIQFNDKEHKYLLEELKKYN